MTTSAARRYRFGFVLSTGGGNLTRYLTLRKFAERDSEVECVWAPNPGYLEPDPFAWAPPILRQRLMVMRLARPVLRELATFDAVMFHTFEPYALASLRSLLARRPVIVWSQDDPPTKDPRFWEDYGLVERPAWRARLRFTVDGFCARRAALLVPFSPWAAARLADVRVAPERVHAVNVGIDLSLWPRAEARAPGRPKILFVGGDFLRKGGDILLAAFERHLAASAELHLVTNRAPAELPPGVFVHPGLEPNDPRLRRLYAEADVLALPTRSDISPFVILEAMATGMPVVASAIAGIPDMVRDGETGFLMPPRDGEALAARLGALVEDGELRRRMGAAGRARVEREFSAETNVRRILGLMKVAADEVRPRTPLLSVPGSG